MAKTSWTCLASLTLVAGCGGGGGSVGSIGTPPVDTTTPVVSTPTPVTPTPTATPTPTPVTINYDDAEYQRSNAASYASAITGYNAGYTGSGIKIAVVDSGIATVGTEFTGRIDAASRDFGGNASFTDTDGHGTAVAAVAAAGRNGANIEGVAFASTILALRADTAGSCAQTDGCSFSTATLATAVDYARTSGAKVINLSLGGSGSSTSLTAAINRATAAGIIVVIAAGNDATDQPDPLAQIASSTAAHGLVIIAGAHDSTGALSSFSDKAGSYGQYYLAALGTRVRSFDNTGTNYLYSGTSFATPAIAGAVALLSQAFPTLTPTQIVNILYRSATDAGASGVDSVYGNGLLNLTRAFQPIGALSLPGSTVAVGVSDTSVMSAPLGDATLGGAGLSKAIVLDSYGRAFGMDLAPNIARMSVSRPLLQGIGGDYHAFSGGTKGFSFSGTVALRPSSRALVGLALGGQGLHPDIAATPIDGAATLRLTPTLSAGVAFSQSGRLLGQRLGSSEVTGSFLAAQASDMLPGFYGRRTTSIGLRRDTGPLVISASAESGSVPVASTIDHATPTYRVATISAERRLGAFTVRIGTAQLDEAGTMIGARLAPALGRAGATTRFLDLGARMQIGGGWHAEAGWRRGWTRAAASGLLTDGKLATSSTSVDFSHDGRSTRFGLRFAMPARVTSGTLVLAVPTSYDYETLAAGYSDTRLDLAPHGRERDVEANWGTRIGAGWLDSNLFLRSQPGNIAAAPNDLGGALRFSLGF